MKNIYLLLGFILILFSSFANAEELIVVDAIFDGSDSNSNPAGYIFEPVEEFEVFGVYKDSGTTKSTCEIYNYSATPQLITSGSFFGNYCMFGTSINLSIDFDYIVNGKTGTGSVFVDSPTHPLDIINDSTVYAQTLTGVFFNGANWINITNPYDIVAFNGTLLAKEFELNLTNIYNSTGIDIFTVEIDNGTDVLNIITTNGTIFYPKNVEANITVFNITGTEGIFFNQSYINYNTTFNLQSNTSQAYQSIFGFHSLNQTFVLSFNCTIFNNSISGYSFDQNNATNRTTHLIDAGLSNYTCKAARFAENKSGNVNLNNLEVSEIQVNFTDANLQIYGPFTSSTLFNSVNISSDCEQDTKYINISTNQTSFENTTNATYHFFNESIFQFFLNIDANECSWIELETFFEEIPVNFSYWKSRYDDLYIRVNLTEGTTRLVIDTVNGYNPDGRATFDLFDDFNDNTLNTNLWESYTCDEGSIQEAGGVLTLIFGAGDLSRPYLKSINEYPYNISFEVEALSNSSNGQVWLISGWNGTSDTDAFCRPKQSFASQIDQSNLYLNENGTGINVTAAPGDRDILNTLSFKNTNNTIFAEYINTNLTVFSKNINVFNNYFIAAAGRESIAISKIDDLRLSKVTFNEPSINYSCGVSSCTVDIINNEDFDLLNYTIKIKNFTAFVPNFNIYEIDIVDYTPGNITYLANGTETNKTVELGTVINLFANTTNESNIVCFKVDHHTLENQELGCGLQNASYNLTIDSFRTGTDERGEIIFNITYNDTFGFNHSFNISAHQLDEVDWLNFTLLGYELNDSSLSNISIYLGDELQVTYTNIDDLGFALVETFNDGNSTKTTTFSQSATQTVGTVLIPFGSTINSARINITGEVPSSTETTCSMKQANRLDESNPSISNCPINPGIITATDISTNYIFGWTDEESCFPYKSDIQSAIFNFSILSVSNSGTIIFDTKGQTSSSTGCSACMSFSGYGTCGGPGITDSQSFSSTGVFSTDVTSIYNSAEATRTFLYHRAYTSTTFSGTISGGSSAKVTIDYITKIYNPIYYTGTNITWSFNEGFYTVTTILNNLTDQLQYYIDEICNIDDDGNCQVPLRVFSESPGNFTIDNIFINYTGTSTGRQEVSLNSSNVENYLLDKENYTNITIDIISNTSGILEIANISYEYKGGNRTIQTFAYEQTNNSNNVTINLTYFYSRYNFTLPIFIDFLEFIPSKGPTDKNVTPYGQNYNTPIFNITYLGYHSLGNNMSIHLNETFSCVNLTYNTNFTNTNIVMPNSTWLLLKENISQEQSYGIWMWADYECDFSSWFLWDPLLSFRACCDGCICSEDFE